MPIRFFAAGIFLGIAIFAGTASRAAECDCTNLSILQVELRNALRVQAAYRGQIAALRGMSVEASQDTLGRFAVMAAHANLEADGSGTTREVEYVPYGIGVDVGLYDTPRPWPDTAATARPALRDARLQRRRAQRRGGCGAVQRDRPRDQGA